MKRKMAVLLTGAMVMATLAGCGGGEAAPAAETAAPAAEEEASAEEEAPAAEEAAETPAE